VKYGNFNTKTNVVGTIPDIIEMQNYSLSKERFFDKDEDKGLGRVAVIGQTVVKNIIAAISLLVGGMDYEKTYNREKTSILDGENMKGRESGMPEKGLWEQFFNPGKILIIMQVDEGVKNVAEFGCGYGTYTIPAAKMVMGTVYVPLILRKK